MVCPRAPRDPRRGTCCAFWTTDYFCALFAILYFSTPQLPNAPLWVQAAAIAVFAAAWYRPAPLARIRGPVPHDGRARAAAGCRVDTEPHGGIGGGFRITLAMEKERSK